VRGEVSRGARLALAVALVLVAAGPALGQPCPDCLHAGAARVSLAVPVGTPLAGYGGAARRAWLPDIFARHPHVFWFKPSEGTRDALAARALVLDAGDRRAVWIAVDLLAVDRAFTAEVGRRLQGAGIRPGALVISASHTHSGPGAFVDSAVLGWLALDRLDGTVREALLDAVVSSVRQATGASRPARLATGSVATPPLVRSRLGQPTDPELVVLRVVDGTGAPIALVWNYAIHGTTLGPRNLRLSGDVMGEASRRLERVLGVPALFVNGAVGDVSPGRHGNEAAVDLGAELAAAAQAGWAQSEPVERPTLAVGQRTVALPAPFLALHNCVGWLPKGSGLPLGSVFPRDATLTAVVAGDVGWVTLPGELQTSLGREIKQTPGLRRVLVAGVSNDYLGYFVSASDYDRPSYISCSTLYGAHAGGCLAGAASALLAAVARGEAPPDAPVSCDR
jgi:neutral ceramidase